MSAPGIGDLHAEIGADRGLRRLDLLRLAEAVEDDRGARRGERAGDAKPDSAGRSGHQGHLVLEGLRGRCRRALSWRCSWPGTPRSAVATRRRFVDEDHAQGPASDRKCPLAKDSIGSRYGRLKRLAEAGKSWISQASPRRSASPKSGAWPSNHLDGKPVTSVQLRSQQRREPGLSLSMIVCRVRNQAGLRPGRPLKRGPCSRAAIMSRSRID